MWLTEGSYSKYSSIDDRIDPFHYYTTLIKFGLGRASYDAAQEIRNHHLTREEGVALVRRFDGEVPRKWLQEKAFDLQLGQWDADLDPDETIFPELHSKETWNAGRWNNPEFDRAVEAAREEADQKKRKGFYDQAVKQIIEDVPTATIFHANEQKVFHKYVKGFQVVPANLINMHGVWLEK